LILLPLRPPTGQRQRDPARRRAGFFLKLICSLAKKFQTAP
jgi:hypothetical protein